MNKNYFKNLHSEVDSLPYVVLLKFQEMPNLIRITYSKRKNGIIKAIEEVTDNEEVICGCKFRGRTANCDAHGYWIKDLRKDLTGFKAMDWLINSSYFDSYTQKGAKPKE